MHGQFGGNKQCVLGLFKHVRFLGVTTTLLYYTCPKNLNEPNNKLIVYIPHTYGLGKLKSKHHNTISFNLSCLVSNILTLISHMASSFLIRSAYLFSLILLFKPDLPCGLTHETFILASPPHTFELQAIFGSTSL